MNPPKSLFDAIFEVQYDVASTSWHPVCVIHLDGPNAYCYMESEDWDVLPYPMRNKIAPGSIFRIALERLRIDGA